MVMTWTKGVVVEVKGERHCGYKRHIRRVNSTGCGDRLVMGGEVSRVTIRSVHLDGWRLFCKIWNTGRRPGSKGAEGED